MKPSKKDLMQMSSLSHEYIKRIYGNAKGQGLDNEALHSLVFRLTGKDSIRKLSRTEAESIIENLGGRKHYRKYTNSGQGMISEGQTKLLFALMYKLSALDGRGNNVGQRLLGLAKKMHRRDKLEWLTKKEASELTEALKNMIEREKNNGNIENSKSGYTAKQNEAVKSG